MATTASVPDALNSSRPTLATPNQGLSSRANRVAATRSSTSRARANRSRRCGGAFHSVAMGPSYQVGHAVNVVTVAPAGQLGQDSCRCARGGEGGGTDLGGSTPRGQQLGRFGTGGHPADADYRRVGKGPAALEHGPDR